MDEKYNAHRSVIPGLGFIANAIKMAAERSARWADSGYPQDSFFAPDSRMDSAPASEFSPLAAANDSTHAASNQGR